MRFDFLRALRFSTVASFLILAACLSPASADVIYNGGAPDQGGQIYSETPAVAAMSFQLAPGETDITGINWWGGCYPATTCGSSPFFDVTIWSDNAGLPGTVLDFAPVGTGNQTATGNMINGPTGWDEYAYSVSIPEVTNLSSGTTYFLEIQETESEGSGNWGWETTSSAPSGAFLEWFDGTNWNSQPQQLAFEFTSSASAVPEPASLPVLCTGVVFLFALWQRSRRSRASSGRSRYRSPSCETDTIGGQPSQR